MMSAAAGTVVRFTAEQIAPCGMNCGICSAYLAYIHDIPRKRGKISHCSGCRARGKQCAYLKKNCGRIGKGKLTFCYECEDFPCGRLKHIDERYRLNYGISFIGNLAAIRDSGMEPFLRKQERAFRCRKCGIDVVCVHNGKCYECDAVTDWRGRR